MRRRTREIRDSLIMLVAGIIIAAALMVATVEAAVKEMEIKEQLACKNWSAAYKHDYCND